MGKSVGTADRILDRAGQLVMAGGYNGFSFADIAATVRIRKASIHHHFPSKAELVRALVAQYRAEAQAQMMVLDQSFESPAARLRAYAVNWEKSVADARAPICICAQLSTELPQLPAEVAVEVWAHFKTLSSWFTAVFEEGVRLGEFRLQAEARTEAELLLASIHGAMLSARAYGNATVFGEIIRAQISRVSPILELDEWDRRPSSPPSL